MWNGSQLALLDAIDCMATNRTNLSALSNENQIVGLEKLDAAWSGEKQEH